MVKDLTLGQTAQFLKTNDNYLILTHSSPDGDTVGSGFALKYILEKIGKKATVRNAEVIPEKFLRFIEAEKDEEFEIETIVSVDLADTKLLTDLEEAYGDKIVLSIDHHPTNKGYSKNRLLWPTAAAATEIICALSEELEVKLDKKIANAIYLGAATDTGCFKFSNTTENTHLVAAKTILAGADHVAINREFFETKSKQRLALENKVIGNMEYYFDGRVAFATISYDDFVSSGCNDTDIDGISSIPRTVEGVQIGITMREKEPSVFKFSVRSFEPYDASRICAALGGGGHKAAAGCKISRENGEIAKKEMLEAVRKEITL